jgi:hypothetical protein
MKILKCFVVFMFWGIETYAQSMIARRDSVLQSSIVIKLTPHPLLFEAAVAGEIVIGGQDLRFSANKRTRIEEAYSSILPSNQHLIKDQILDYKDIEKIRRRNYLFLIPNRLRILMKNGDSYIFLTWRRKKIFDAYKRYQASSSLAVNGKQ